MAEQIIPTDCAVRVLYRGELSPHWESHNFVAEDSPLLVSKTRIVIYNHRGTIVSRLTGVNNRCYLVLFPCGSKLAISSAWLDPVSPLEQLAEQI